VCDRMFNYYLDVRLQTVYINHFKEGCTDFQRILETISKFLDAVKALCSKLHTEDPKILGATVHNCRHGYRRPKFVHFCIGTQILCIIFTPLFKSYEGP
jgi:hypothetical protein